MEPLGPDLKRAREASGISLHEMAARTKISITALESLERNDFRRLPGGISGRAFVRAYAAEVGIEPDAAVSRFSALLEQAEREEAERKAAKRPEITLDDRQFLQRQQRAMMTLRIVLVVVLIAVIAVAVWQGRAFLQRRAASKALALAAASTPAPAVTFPQAPTAGEAQPETVVAREGTAKMVVEFDLTGESFLSVSVDSGPPIFARVFQPGEHPRVEADHDVVLDVGNGGVVRMAINGRQTKPLGKNGQRQRTRITRDNLAAFFD